MFNPFPTFSLVCFRFFFSPKVGGLCGGGTVGMFVLWKGQWLQSEVGVGAKVAAKAPINTLIAAWQEQAVLVKDMLWHWQYGGGGKTFPTGRCTVLWSQSMNWNALGPMPWGWWVQLGSKSSVFVNIHEWYQWINSYNHGGKACREQMQWGG